MTNAKPKGVKDIPDDIQREEDVLSLERADDHLPIPIPWGVVFGESVVSSNELDEVDVPKRPSLIGGWFKEGDLGYICAQRGVGKTHFAMMLAKALAGPTKHIGPWECPGNCPVLYVDGEMPLDDIRLRDQAYLNIEDGSTVRYLNHEVVFTESEREINLVDAEFQKALLSYCKAEGIKVVFFDNLSSLAIGMKENDADHWEKVKPWLLRFRRAGIAVVIVHHAGRNGNPRGTSKREDDAFWLIHLEDDPDESTEGARFKMRFSKNRNDPGKNEVISWHFQPQDNGRILPVYRRVDSQHDFLELIRSGINRNKDLAEAMGWKPPRVTKLARKLKEQRKLAIENQTYRLLD